MRSNRPLRLTGRIYNDDGGATYGQLSDLGVMDSGLRAGDAVSMVGLRQQVGLFRTNLTLANTGFWQGEIDVTLGEIPETVLAKWIGRHMLEHASIEIAQK